MVTMVNEELKRAYDDLEAFSYSVAHDLRAPLRAIDGFSQILAEDYAAQLDDEAKRVVGVVTENVRRMEALIDDLLSFSRVGRAAITTRLVDMAPIVREAADWMRALEPERRIDVGIGPMGHVPCDPAMIKQVWTNLLANAFKFTRCRAVAHIDIRREDRPGEVVYSVRDDGAGFDMRYAAKLFGVFQRLHRADEFEGTGIGLALVRRIVLRHGGWVAAEGEIDRGASLSFALPTQEWAVHQ
ncbi:MAG: ATP-binding protein [Actinomycetota bacterium]